MAEVFSHDQSIPIQHKATSSLRIPDDWLTEVKNMNNEQMQGLVLVLRSRNEAQAREISELRSELASLRLSVSRAKESPFQVHVWDALKTVFLWALVMNLAVLCVNIMKAV